MGILKRRVNFFRTQHRGAKKAAEIADEDHQVRILKAKRSPARETFTEPITNKGEETAQMESIKRWSKKKLKRWQAIRRETVGHLVKRKRRLRLKKKGK